MAFFQVQSVEAEQYGTETQGILTEDTVWTKENSPYFLTGEVQLAYGASLTIEPGVHVYSKGYAIKVWGDLIVKGTAEDQVFFNQVRIEPYGKLYENSSLNIEHAYINRGDIYSFNTSYSSLILRDSVLNRVGNLDIYYPKADSYIERNIFIETGGIRFGSDRGRVLEFRNNLFYRQIYPYYIQSRVFASEETKFEKNSFIEISTPIKLTDSSIAFNLNARQNYWGITDTAELDKRIYDKKDKLESAGYVEYDPILTEPDQMTPAVEDIPLSPPSFWEISDLTEGVKGSADPNASVTIKDGDRLIGEAKADSNGQYYIPIEPQEAGSVLMVQSERDGEKSLAVAAVVEVSMDTYPTAPTIKDADRFTDHTENISGSTSAWATVFITRDGKIIAQKKTGMDGTFSVSIPPQPGGSTLAVYAENSKGLKSESLMISVKDTTSPANPDVDPISNNDDKISGTAEPYSKITVTKDDWYWVGQTTADEEGNFELAIEKSVPGTLYFVRAEDAAKNKSGETMMAVVDRIAPVWETDGPIKILDVDDHYVSFSWPKANDEYTSSGNMRYRIYLNGLPMIDKQMEETLLRMSVLEPGAKHTLEIIASDEAGNLSKLLSAEFIALKFVDVNLYKEEIHYLASKEIIKGYPDGTFKPEKTINRMQAVQMILRAKGIDAETVTAENPNFSDMKPGQYGYEEVAAAVQMGIISGKTDSRTGEKFFDPWGTLTRAQMAKTLVNAYSLNSEGEPNPFNDISFDFWAKDYITALYAAEITTGYPDGTFRPNQSISRQHFSVFLARYLQ